MLSATLMGVQRMQPVAFVGALAKVVHTAAVVVALQSGYGLYTVAAFASIPWIVIVLFGWLYSRRYVGRGASLQLTTLKTIAIGGLPFLVWQASQTIYGQLDILQLSLMTDDSVVGWYSAAYQIILIPAFLPTILLMAVYPMLSTLAHTNREEFSEISRRCLQVLMLTVTPIAFGTLILADRFVALFGYPDEFDNAIPLIAILALQMPSAAASTLLGTCLMALDRQISWAKVGVAAAVLNPLINLFFIPVTSSMWGNGAIGAAITTVLTEFFMVTWAALILPRGIFRFEDLRYSALCVLAGAIMAGMVWTIRDANLMLAIGTGGLVYLVAAIALGTLRIRDANLVLSYFRGVVLPQTREGTAL
jgi:O-antigen/teichoic acid export membrane protein